MWNKTRLAVQCKRLGTVEQCAQGDVYVYQSLCLLSRPQRIAGCRLSCHFPTQGLDRELGICHQDVMFFRADPQFRVVRKSQMWETVNSLITSSSEVDCGCGCTHSDTWTETWAQFSRSGLAACFISSQLSTDSQVSSGPTKAHILQSSHHMVYVRMLTFLPEKLICCFSLLNHLPSVFFKCSPSTFGHRQTVLFHCKCFISQWHPWPCRITVLKLELL